MILGEREQLADLCHRQWAGWMEYLFSKCVSYKPEKVQAEEGALIIPKWAVERWIRQMNTKYKDLSKEEKGSDLKEADKFIKLIEGELG